MDMYDSYDMENLHDNSKKMIGGRVPIEFAETFTNYCNDNGINRSVLFHNLAKWWLELPESIQWLIYRGKTKEAHRQIAAEVEADTIVSDAEADVAKQKRKQHRIRPSKSG